MLLLLLLLDLMMRCKGQEGQQLFEKLQFHAAQWDAVDTEFTSFLACSQMCGLRHPVCKAFSWESGTCRHGSPNFKQEMTGGLVNGFMRSTEKRVMDLLATLSAEQHAERLGIFLETQFVIGQELFWRSRDKANFEEGRDACSRFGGSLPVLYDKEVFDEFIATVITLEDDHATRLGLEMTSKTNCTQSECDGKMTWADGQPFSYSKVEQHFRCVDVNQQPTHQAMGIHHTSYCNWRLHDGNGIAKHLFACHFRL